jgi:transglutaminase-like putative cysteine protease
MQLYLRPTEIIDWRTPAVLRQAQRLAADVMETIDITRACFEWVRDGIQHSGDHEAQVTTCRASEVLAEGTGWCFAKSHLLAALLRANGIPAGFCYQRLRRDDGNGFTLHGLNGVHLPGIGWYRIDGRGNKPGIDAQFCPPEEKLAYLPLEDGERDFPEIWPDPALVVVECLKRNEGWEKVRSNLPDIAMVESSPHR